MNDTPSEVSTGTMPAAPEMHTSSRDRDTLGRQLEAWMAGVLPAGADPEVHEARGRDTNGMSSDTVLFRASWLDPEGKRTDHDLVARIAPDDADVPVFADYDLRRQFDAMRIVGELTDVPVPDVHWFEPGAHVVGSPFFVMDRVDGRVPPDVMPYNFGDSWLFDASRDDQAHLQTATVAAIAALHAIEDPARLPAWLITTTRRLVWRALVNRRKEQPLEAAELTESELPTYGVPGITPPLTLAELMSGWQRQYLLA